MLRNAVGVGCVSFPRKKNYEGVSVNVISVTRGWVGVKFPGKKRYITLEWPLTLFRYPDKRIVNIMKVYFERNNLQLQSIRYRKQMFTLFTYYFCEAAVSMQYRSPNANQEVSNTNHFGAVSDSLGRLAIASQLIFVVNLLL